jgi:hypothetical protein
MRKFISANGRSVTTYDISELFGTAYLKEQMGVNAVMAFEQLEFIQ